MLSWFDLWLVRFQWFGVNSLQLESLCVLAICDRILFHPFLDFQWMQAGKKHEKTVKYCPTILHILLTWWIVVYVVTLESDYSALTAVGAVLWLAARRGDLNVWLWPDILTWSFGFFKKIQPCWRCPQGETRLNHKGKNSPRSHGDFKEGCRPVRQQRDLVAVFRKRLLQRAMGLSLSTWKLAKGFRIFFEWLCWIWLCGIVTTHDGPCLTVTSRWKNIKPVVFEICCHWGHWAMSLHCGQLRGWSLKVGCYRNILHGTTINDDDMIGYLLSFISLNPDSRACRFHVSLQDSGPLGHRCQDVVCWICHTMSLISRVL